MADAATKPSGVWRRLTAAAGGPILTRGEAGAGCSEKYGVNLG
jgi:hypothetical protein